MSDILRDFWKKVAGIDKQPNGAGDGQAQAAATQKEAQATEQQAEALAFKAQLMKRLGDLAGPFKEAVGGGGRQTQQLHTLFGQIKNHLGKHQLVEASKDLDALEQLLDRLSGQVPDRGDDLAKPEVLAAPTEKQVSGPPPPTPKPTSQPAPQSAPTTTVNASCLITVTNNTKAVLTLKHQNPEHGEFMSNPDTTVQPGASTKFVYVQTPHEQDPNKQGCKGSVTWQVGSPLTAIWRVEWNNHVGQKNTVQATLDPQSAGFESLEQIGQGDENIPVAVTVSGVGAGPTPTPTPTPTPVPTVAVLQSITFSPANPSLVGGAQQQFTATGRFSDGSSKDLTKAVAWSSSATNVVALDNGGLATAQKVPGTATITATDAKTGVTGATTVTVMVPTPVLQSITIGVLGRNWPGDGTLPSGSGSQFTATGQFSDGSTQDLTFQVTWSSSASEIVSIGSNNGFAEVIPQVGTATITATDAKTGVKATTTVIARGRGQADDKIEAAIQGALNKKPPDKGALQKLVEKNGVRALDEVVKKMPDPPDRGQILTAIEARFGIKMTAEDLSNKDAQLEGQADAVGEMNKSLKNLYETMLKVPEIDVENNPSLKEIDRSRREHDEGDYYQSGKKRIHLAAYGVNTGHPQIGNPKELPDVDDDCKPKGIPPPPTHLGWNSLHEVGHGVDDRLQFMKARLGNAAFGDWKNETVSSVAAVVGAFFVYEKDYITKVLSGKATDPLPPSPAPKPGTDPVIWETQRQKAVEWCRAVRTKNELWDKGSESAKRAINGRAYHEAYDDPVQWVSYGLAARKKGITGYQFRAPGEWFAELYAAYHLGKLKDSNPNVVWLEKVL